MSDTFWKMAKIWANTCQNCGTVLLKAEAAADGNVMDAHNLEATDALDSTLY